MDGPKVVVIGAGSLFFGRQALWQMVHSEVLRTGTLAFVDTDADRLDKMVRLGRMVVEDQSVPLAIEGSVERRDALPGANFVVLSFADRGVAFRGIDCRISEKYGVRMCSGDTIGPGGIFRAMRELPVILKVADDVRALCPDAWVINYINPTTVNGIGLMRHAPDLKSFALCDGLHMPGAKRRRMVQAGIAPDTDSITLPMEVGFDLRIAGVNHFTWTLKADYEGEDKLPAIRAHIEKLAAEESDEGHSKARFNNAYTLALWDLFGLCPACIAHTKEYVPYWQGHGVADDALPPLSIFDADERQKRHDAQWEEIDGYLAGAAPAAEFMEKHGPDHATDIIESMWGGLRKPFYVNTANRGAVQNLDDDAFLEVLCDIDMEGPRPRTGIGRFPPGVRAMTQQVLETHELTVEAIVRRDRAVLRRAMMLDPIVNAIPDGDAIIAELLDAERDALPPEWSEGRRP